MACVWLISLLLFSCLLIAKANDCVIYDFENEVTNPLGNEKSLCVGMSPWTVGNYSEIGLAQPDRNSGSFISPSTTLSCGSSYDFTMAAGGVVEINLYMDSGAPTDQISVLVFEVVPGGNDAVVGSVMHFPMDPNFVSGWRTLRINAVTSVATFQGYISFIGMASEESLILIDSFRYIPPAVSQETCTIYREESTQPATAILDTTTQRTDGIEDCVTYNFETDFDIRFTTDNYLCDGFLSWHLGNYTSSDIESPNPQSTVFMAPNEISSCIASFVFEMAPDGIIEANIFMDPVTSLDHIIVLAQKVTGREYDTVAGFKMYYPANHVFVTGWNVLRFTLLDFTSFKGYLIFIGSAEKGSTVLVDSVRYIPPSTPVDDASCSLY